MSKDAIADALRLARRKKKPVRFHHTIAREGYQDGGVPDEANQQAFLQERLKGSAPQYVQESDFPARAAHAVEAADRYAGKVNNMLADIAGQPEMRSPEGRRAAEIVTAPIPPDPNEVSKQAMEQYRAGDRLGAAETMMGGMPQTGAIRAYHGSPHLFDRFDMSKIGTGEGAQAYGHGLYFAESEPVARSYRDKLGMGNVEINGRPAIDLASEGYALPYGQSPSVEHKIADIISSYGDNARPVMEARYPELLKAYEEMKASGSIKEPGHMYEVELGVEPHQLLDWDKPLSEQSPLVQQALLKTGWSPEHMKSSVLDGGYVAPTTPYGSSKYAEAGIPGIRYLDQGSRGAGEGSHNYVIFDDNLINLLRRYADGGAVDGALRLARRGYATDGAVASQESSEEPEAQAYGEVSFAPEYTPRPQEEAKQPDDANQEAFIREGLKGSAPQYDPSVETGLKNAAIAGAKWTAPGAAADAMGMLGGPSMAENIRQGRYLPAAMQAVAVGLPTAMAGRAAINAGLGAGASKFTKLGKPDVFLAPGYVAEQTAEDWAPGVFGKKTYEGAKMAGKRAIEEAGDYIRKKIGYADGGEVDDALRIARQSGGKTPAWQRAEGKNPEGGLSAKGRASAKREGMNLKPPAPHPKTEKDAGRRKSFCSRMKGMKAKLTSAETARDPDSRINKSLRAWNCADGGAVEDAVKLAKGGEIWDKDRPKGLGKPKKLSESQKSSAKAAAKAAGRPWPNMIDNINAAKKG